MLLLTQIINGLSLGMVYALIAVGYSLIYSILRLVNFSHSSVYAFGAHMAMLFVSLNMGIGWAIALCIVFSGILNIAIDRLCMAPLRAKKTDGATMVIATIGVSYIIQNGLMLVFGSQVKPFPKLFDYGALQIGGVSVASSQLAMSAVALGLLVLLSVLINCTKLGLATRAVQQNTKAANLMGINVKSVITFIFFISGVSAAIAGSLIGGYYEMVYPTMGAVIGMKAFAATVLGGMGVLHGALFGGLVIGLCESLTVHFISGSYRDSVAFIILVVVLIFKPNGLFGKQESTKV